MLFNELRKYFSKYITKYLQLKIPQWKGTLLNTVGYGIKLYQVNTIVVINTDMQTILLKINCSQNMCKYIQNVYYVNIYLRMQTQSNGVIPKRLKVINS